MSKKILKKISGLVCVLLIFNSIFINQAYASSTDIPTYYSHEDLLNMINNLSTNPHRLLLPNMQSPGYSQAALQPPVSIGVTLPSPPPITNQMEHPVALATGYLRIEENDLTLSGYGLDLIINRYYSSGIDGSEHDLGNGWSHNLGSYLRMYADFHIAEIKADGSVTNFNFVMADPNAHVLSYDGDNLINYDLSKGYYETTENGSTLTRIGPDEYVVTSNEGVKSSYKGYIAPWRVNQPKDQGQLISIRDPYGNQQSFTYNAEGKIIQIIDSAQRTVSISWQGAKISSIRVGDNYSLSYSYDNNGNLISFTNADGDTVKYNYNSNKKIISKEDQEGGITTYQYNSQGKVSKIINALNQEQFTFNYTDNTTIMTDALGSAWTYKFNDKKLLIEEKNPLNEVTTYQYNEVGYPVKITTPLGTTNIEYDSKNRPIKEIAPDGGIKLTEYHTKWQKPITETNAVGAITRYEYDQFGKLKKIINSLGYETLYQYNARGKVESITVDNNKREFEYDLMGNLTKSISATGEETSYEYDSLGRITATIEANEAKTEMIYSKGGRLVKTNRAYWKFYNIHI